VGSVIDDAAAELGGRQYRGMQKDPGEHGNVSLGGFLSSLGCIDRWVRGRSVMRIGWKDADCKIVLVAYSV